MLSILGKIIFAGLCLLASPGHAEDDERQPEKIGYSYLAKPEASWSRARVGDRVETVGGLGCFRFSETEYRCVKQVLEYGVVITAPIVNSMTMREQVDDNCSTFVRGMKDRKCGFNVRFTVAARGLDHMEKIRFYQAETMELIPWSKW